MLRWPKSLHAVRIPLKQFLKSENTFHFLRVLRFFSFKVPLKVDLQINTNWEEKKKGGEVNVHNKVGKLSKQRGLEFKGTRLS